MPKRVLGRINRALEAWLPEQRLFLKSDSQTRFVRLRPGTQAAGIAGAGLLLAWSIVATAMLMMDSLSAGSGREQARGERAAFEARIEALSQDRNAHAAEARDAQARFALALAEVSAMQSRLLSIEERHREVETGLDVVQATLRRTIAERDAARAEVAALRETLAERGGAGSPELARAEDAAATLTLLSEALADLAAERDAVRNEHSEAVALAEMAALEKRLLEEQNNEIFSRLEQALTVSVEPLERMFRAAGLKPDDMLREVRRGQSTASVTPATLRMSTKGAETHPDVARANTILTGLDRMAAYRAAAAKAPFANPVRGNYRYTSGFGYRRDPKTGGSRMHAGTDFAGARGTPIHSTADGVVVHAGWQSGYGQMVTIRHAFGIETRYAHLSRIRVSVGQTVSRGDRIGDMGNTGRSTGTHLHYEVRIGGRPVNPMTYIKAARDVF
jgi:murein DD-endopeptidase MepM/ murein hydrolase activator NlpD